MPATFTPGGRWARMAVVGGLHALVLALLLRATAPPPSTPAAGVLRLFDVAPPPLPPPMPKRPPHSTHSGGRPQAAPVRPIAATPILPTVEQPSPMLLPQADLAGTVGDGGLGLGSGLGKGSGSGDGDPPAAPPVQVTAPRWVWKPSEAQLAPFVPRPARSQRVSGTVLLMCRVSLRQRARHCRVLDERPRGFGFGDAALDATRMFRIYPVELGGVAVDDAPVAIPIEFVAR